MKSPPRPALKMPLAARQRPVGVAPELPESNPDVFDWYGRPCNLYLQSSLSFLCCALGARTTLPQRYPCMSGTSMGVTLVIELPERPGATEPLVGPLPAGVRVCDVAVLGIHLNHPRFAAMRQASRVQPLVRQSQSYQAFLPALVSAAQGEMDAEAARLLVVSIIDHVLQLAGCEGVRLDPRVEASILYSDREQSCHLREVAASIGISPSRLSHLFSENVGMSFRQYALWCRTMQTWDLVVFSAEKSLTEIAYEMEFSDLAHFSRAFKLVFGVTPSALRDLSNVRMVGRLAGRGRRAVPSSEWPV